MHNDQSIQVSSKTCSRKDETRQAPKHVLKYWIIRRKHREWLIKYLRYGHHTQSFFEFPAKRHHSQKGQTFDSSVEPRLYSIQMSILFILPLHLCFIRLVNTHASFHIYSASQNNWHARNWLNFLCWRFFHCHFWRAFTIHLHTSLLQSGVNSVNGAIDLARR